MGSLIQLILEHEGFEVHRAEDGRLGEAAINRLAPPALVTIDINLPYMNGVELLMRMRSKRGWENVPILMVTANEYDSKVGWAIKSGANAYIVKPFERQALLDCIRRLLGP